MNLCHNVENGNAFGVNNRTIIPTAGPETCEDHLFSVVFLQDQDDRSDGRLALKAPFLECDTKFTLITARPLS